LSYPDSDACFRGDSDRHFNFDCYAHCYHDRYRDDDRDWNADRHSNFNRNGHRNSDSNRDRYCRGDGHHDTHSESDADRHMPGVCGVRRTKCCQGTQIAGYQTDQVSIADVRHYQFARHYQYSCNRRPDDFGR
jgi:hypothetical protein